MRPLLRPSPRSFGGEAPVRPSVRSRAGVVASLSLPPFLPGFHKSLIIIISDWGRRRADWREGGGRTDGRRSLGLSLRGTGAEEEGDLVAVLLVLTTEEEEKQQQQEMEAVEG